MITREENGRKGRETSQEKERETNPEEGRVTSPEKEAAAQRDRAKTAGREPAKARQAKTPGIVKAMNLGADGLRGRERKLNTSGFMCRSGLEERK